jgi:hypothetical protein
MVQEPTNDFLKNTCLNCNSDKRTSMRVRRPQEPLWRDEMPISRLWRGKHPLVTQTPHGREGLLVDIERREVERADVYRHRQVDPILQNVAPPQCERLSPAEAGK